MNYRLVDRHVRWLHLDRDAVVPPFAKVIRAVGPRVSSMRSLRHAVAEHFTCDADHLDWSEFDSE